MPRRLLRLAAPALLLAGCADGGYASSRAMPTSSEDSWSLGARLFHGEESEVYELPARPPAVGERIARAPGAAPGQRFPAFPVVAVDEPARRYEGGNPVQPTGAMAEDSGPAPLPALAREPLAAWRQDQPPGAREPLGVQPVGAIAEDAVSQPASGLDRQPAFPAAAWAEADVWHGDAVPPTSPLR